ncbi:MAG: aminotransferase class IV [Candidatus Delongbacteria bacterium]|nr:aminotransferase class IV [Candidatus Delongbacteria bacterium]
MGRKILFDGKIIFRDNVKAGIDSPALNYGYGLFETILYENRKIYFIKDHLKRLFNSCQVLDIPPPDLNLINENFIYKLIEENGLTKNIVKIKLMYSPIFNEKEWNTIVTVNIYARNSKNIYALVENKVRSNAFYKHKSMSYMQNYHTLISSGEFDEVLLINDHKNIIEGTCTNILCVKDKILYFADGSNDYLFGIMQQNIFKDHRLFGFKKIEALEYGFSRQFIESCDEILLTNSLKIASNVNSINFGSEKIEFKSCKISGLIRDHYLKNNG